MSKITIMPNMKFEAWTVATSDGCKFSAAGNKTAMWWCVCECGSKKSIPAGNLVRGLSKSCGCKKGATISAKVSTHGFSHKSDSDGTYEIWTNMRNRCNNEANHAFKRYGGRGIKVCQRWDDFTLFLQDMGTRPSQDHSIDRIDNDAGYDPTNCRWATKKEQANNRRSNVIFEANGITQNVAQWASSAGVTTQTLHKRLKRGWTIEKAISAKQTTTTENP